MANLIHRVGRTLGNVLFLVSAGLILYGCSTMSNVNSDYRKNKSCFSDSSSDLSSTEIVQIRENIKKSLYNFKKPNAEDSYEYNKFFPGIYQEKSEIKIPLLRFRF